MAASALSIVISARDSASGPIAAVTRALQGMGNAATAPLKGVLELGKGIGMLGVAAGGLATLGQAVGGFATGLIAGNMAMEDVRAQFNAFTKDGNKTESLMKDLRIEADKTPFAYNEMAVAMAGLLPAAKQSNVGVMDLLKNAEILAASNPAQGLEGAAFALREAVSGDYTSIIERFNLPRSYINKLKAEGVPAIEIVRRAMLEMGYDSDLVAAKANTLAGRWSTFSDVLNNIKDRVTAPLFEALKSALGAASTWFETNKTTVDAWAAALTAGVQDAIDFVGRLLGTLGEIGGYLSESNQRDLMREWFGDAGPVIDEVVRNIKLIPGAIKNIGDDLKRTFQLSGWEGVAKKVQDGLAAEWAKIDWAAVWATVGGVATTIAAWLGEQWSKIDWGLIWSGIVGFANGLMDRIGELTAPIEAELKKRWAAIDWAAIWAEAKAGIQSGGSFVAEGAVGNTEAYTAQVRAIDWNAVGTQIGTSFGSAVRSVFELTPADQGGTGATAWFQRAFEAEWDKYVASAEAFSAATSGFVTAFGKAFGGLEGNAMGAYIVKWCDDNITKPLVGFVQGIGPFAAQWATDFTAAFWSGLQSAGSNINVGAWADATFLAPVRAKIAELRNSLGLGGGIGNNANGTNNWGGGLTWVGERGPEIVNLPRGSQVYPANESARMAGASITVNIAVNGGGDAQAIGSAARDGVMQAARSMGVAI